VDLWTCGTVDLWTCGTLDLWTCGLVDLWPCGLVELWTDVDWLTGAVAFRPRAMQGATHFLKGVAFSCSQLLYYWSVTDGECLTGRRKASTSTLIGLHAIIPP